jgi:hypothetical protein
MQDDIPTTMPRNRRIVSCTFLDEIGLLTRIVQAGFPNSTPPTAEAILRFLTEPRNNHDHLKFKHHSRESAEAEINRMQRSHYYKDTGRLRPYYNSELGAWYVGNSKYT